MFLFNFNQLVQVGHLVETYKWYPGGLGSCCKEVSSFLLTKNRQKEGGEEVMELNLAAEKKFTKLFPFCLIKKIMKKESALTSYKILIILEAGRQAYII